MIELIREDDFSELPEEAHYKWIQLERIARGRLQDLLDEATGIPDSVLKNQYMTVVDQLARTYEVPDVSISGAHNIDERLNAFQLDVSRAQTQIWSSVKPDYPFGRVALSTDAKTQILQLSHQIELEINRLEESDARKRALFRLLEDFRREINQPRTRIGTALTWLASLSTVVAMTTTSLAQAPEAFSTIQMILGAEQQSTAGEELRLIEEEKRLLLPSPHKQIAGPR
ncbi:hypothetical protein KDD17_02075 [Sulfitobacter albidus]|uniref:Uncharacterized protein n=1 Tax=Sulfitobacter albidus TaxID=2829501 RepID=A0A975JEJ4_9RHOB|nr:hypothetical protein [Sulfitobacter albidus]QUJ76872.1 hypothetical protein KDD17_02075 [Sulfitobacter albidus]